LKKIKWINFFFEIWVKITQIESFESLIMLDLWPWKLILEEIERIKKSEDSIKLWFGLINDIWSLNEELISLGT
jgi:hypothetical protein